MATSKAIRVMLSSRCNDPFPQGSKTTLSDLRREIKKEIESTKLWGKKVVEVWINEDAPPADGVVYSWEACLDAVNECDVLIVLANGNAGWAKADSDIGICHAEYMQGLNASRGKVRVVMLPFVPTEAGEQGTRNLRFQQYLNAQSPFRGGTVSTVEEAKARVQEALRDALITLTHRGVASAASARFDMGQALDWSRMDFRQRKGVMETVLLEALSKQPGTRSKNGAAVIHLHGQDVVVFAHAIPAAFTVAAARELVGRPFLRDHENAGLLKGSAGPLHLIACHKGATETQATSLLGFPDATVVSGPFGVFVADDVQKVQFAFLANCRDEAQTRHALQRFLEWLVQTGEGVLLAKRAVSRAKIVRLIAAELNVHH